MKKLARKMMSLLMAVFMVLQVVLPAFATSSRAEDENPNAIKSIEKIEDDPDLDLSIKKSQEIYDKKKVEKDKDKFTIAVSIPDTNSKFRLVKRNDLKLFDDKYFDTNEKASKEYWRVKDMLNAQGLDLDLEIIEDANGFKLIAKEEAENKEKENPYGENYSYIDFKIMDDFDFNEKGNQKLLGEDKLVFNLEFLQYESLDPDFNLYEKDKDGNLKIKNQGDIFALLVKDKKSLYDTKKLEEDYNNLKSYKEEKAQTEADQKAQKEAEEKQKQEEAKKAQEEKAKAEKSSSNKEEKTENSKEDSNKEKESKTEIKVESNGTSKEEKETKTDSNKKEETKKSEENKIDSSSNEDKKEEKKIPATSKEKKEKKEEFSKLVKEKKEESKTSSKKAKKGLLDGLKSLLGLTDLQRADKDLKNALADEKNGLKEIQNLLTSFSEKYKLTQEDQAKLMADNEEAIKALIEKDADKNFSPQVLMAAMGSSELTQAEKENLSKKKFTIITRYDISNKNRPVQAGQSFTIHLDEKLTVNDESTLPSIEYNNEVIATPKYNSNNTITYTLTKDINENIQVPLNIPVDYNVGKITLDDDGTFTVINKVTGIGVNNPPKDLVPQKVDKNGNPDGSIIEPGRDDVTQIVDSSKNYRLDIDSVGNPVIENGEMVGINWVVNIESSKDLAKDLGMKMNFTLVEGSGLKEIKSITSSDATEVIQDNNAIKSKTGIVDSKHSVINQSTKSYKYSI
ncbi:MAG: hypothetical protein E7C03_06635, partial [Anaerococcus sp.]|nr:hypothetical protein [Anaerococcus sp.]